MIINYVARRDWDVKSKLLFKAKDILGILLKFHLTKVLRELMKGSAKNAMISKIIRIWKLLFPNF